MKDMPLNLMLSLQDELAQKRCKKLYELNEGRKTYAQLRIENGRLYADAKGRVFYLPRSQNNNKGGLRFINPFYD